MDKEKIFEYCSDFEIISLGEQEIDVYDIEVEDNHNFFANDILIHNSVYINTEPMIPLMIYSYKRILKYFFNKKSPEILKELDDNNFWNRENIIDHFENESDLVKKYFKCQDSIHNGLTEDVFNICVNKSNYDKFKKKTNELGFPLIHVRKNKEGGKINCFIDIENVDKDDYLKLFNDIEIYSINKTYILDDFANTVIQDIIDTNYEDLADYMNAKNKMVMKREAISTNGVFLAAKNYILSVIDNEGEKFQKPKVKITGTLKKDRPPFVRDRIKNFLNILLKQNNITDKESIKIIDDFITEVKEEFFSKKPHEIGFIKQVNFIDKYIGNNGELLKGCLEHAKAAIFYNKYISDNKLTKYEKIQEGDKMRYVYLYKENPWRAEAMGYLGDELPEEINKYVDYHKMLEKSVYGMLEIILKPANNISLDYQRANEIIDDWL